MPFPITCSSCGKSSAISDEVYERKVVGRVVAVKCKHCQANIRVDGTLGRAAESAPSAAGSSPIATASMPSATGGAPITPPFEEKPAAPPVEEKPAAPPPSSKPRTEPVAAATTEPQASSAQTSPETTSPEAPKSSEPAKPTAATKPDAAPISGSKAPAPSSAKAGAASSKAARTSAPDLNAKATARTSAPDLNAKATARTSAPDLNAKLGARGSAPDLSSKLAGKAKTDVGKRPPLGSAPELAPKSGARGATSARDVLTSAPEIDVRASSPELDPKLAARTSSPELNAKVARPGGASGSPLGLKSRADRLTQTHPEAPASRRAANIGASAPASAPATTPKAPAASSKFGSSAAQTARLPIGGAKAGVSRGFQPKAPATGTPLPQVATKAPLPAARPRMVTEIGIGETPPISAPVSSTAVTPRAAPVAEQKLDLPVTRPPVDTVSDDVLWAVDSADGQDRELLQSEIAIEIRAGLLNAQTLVWREGMGEWEEIADVPELAAYLKKPEELASTTLETRTKTSDAEKADVPYPRHSATRPEAPVAKGLRSSAPPSPEQIAAAAPPVAPAITSLAVPDEEADDEATVVWSPKSSPENEAPEVPPAPALPQFAEAIPQPKPPASAPKPFAPPFPRPVATPPPIALPTRNEPALQQSPSAALPDVDFSRKSRAPLILIGILVIAAIVIAIVFATQKSQPPIPEIPTQSSTPPAEPTKPQDTPQPNEPSDSPSSEADDSARTSSTPLDDSKRRSGDFADMFAQGAKRVDGAKFDPNAAKTALNAAVLEVKNCRERGGPTGRVDVSVTFEPSGKVSSATIGDGPFAGTSTGTCISSAFKRVKIAPFTGLPGTVSKAVYIQ